MLSAKHEWTLVRLALNIKRLHIKRLHTLQEA